MVAAPSMAIARFATAPARPPPQGSGVRSSLLPSNAPIRQPSASKLRSSESFRCPLNWIAENASVSAALRSAPVAWVLTHMKLGGALGRMRLGSGAKKPIVLTSRAMASIAVSSSPGVAPNSEISASGTLVRATHGFVTVASAFAADAASAAVGQTPPARPIR